MKDTSYCITLAQWDHERHRLFYHISPVGPWKTQVACITLAQWDHEKHKWLYHISPVGLRKASCCITLVQTDRARRRLHCYVSPVWPWKTHVSISQLSGTKKETSCCYFNGIHPVLFLKKSKQYHIISPTQLCICRVTLHVLDDGLFNLKCVEFF